MPAMIETIAYNKGTGMPWHKLGVSVEGAQTSEAMIVAAGLDWTTRTVEITTVEADEIPFKRAVVRDGNVPDGATRVLGVVGPEYTPVSNGELFAFLDGLVSDGLMRYDTAGSLKGGRVVWMLGVMGDDWRIGDDVHKTYIAGTAGHDGGLAIAAQPTAVRIVCANTHRMVFGNDAHNAMIHIRHTANVREQMKEAQRLYHITTESERRYRDWLESVQRESVESAAVNDLLIDMFGDPDKAETLRIAKSINTAVETFKGRYLVPEIARGGRNGYSLLNALTGYADHALRYQGDATKQAESQFASTVIRGRAVAFKDKASALVSQLVGVAI